MQAGVYQHYKGELYYVIGLVTHSETSEDMVLYFPLYVHPSGGRPFKVRPLSNWNDPQDGKPRFVFVSDVLPDKTLPTYKGMIL